MTTDNFRLYLQNRLIQTSQTGGQRYSDTSPFSIPWFGKRTSLLGTEFILAVKRLKGKVRGRVFITLPSYFISFFFLVECECGRSRNNSIKLFAHFFTGKLERFVRANISTTVKSCSLDDRVVPYCFAFIPFARGWIRIQELRT